MTIFEEFKKETDRLAGDDTIAWDYFDKWGVMYIALCNVLEARLKQPTDGVTK